MSEAAGEPFELEPSPPAGGYTAAGLSRWLADPKRNVPVSDQTVRNWAQQGMPHHREHPDAAATFPDPQACLNWIRGNVHDFAARTRGGKRHGAGRKSAEAQALQTAAGTVQAQPLVVAAEAAAAATMTRTQHLEAVKEAIRLGKTPPIDLARAGSREYLGELCSVGGASKVVLDTIGDVLTLERRQIALDADRGKLIDKAVGCAEVADYALLLRAHIEALPEQLARELVAVLALPVERINDIMVAVEKVTAPIFRAMADAPLREDDDQGTRRTDEQ